MKITVAVVFLLGCSALASGQGNPSTSPPTNQVGVPSFGLETGQAAPSFALPDQFGHEQSNATLKGSNGTVLLFFRSADW